MPKVLRVAVATFAAALAMPALAQEVTVYRDTGFNGPAVAISRDDPNLRMGFTINAIRVRGGTWELCSGVRFRGQCITVARDTPNLRNSFNWPGPLNSIRLVSAPQPPDTRPPPPGSAQSLRGMAAEFFPAPALMGRRVLACRIGSATAACARQSAEEFCRAVGWNYARHALMETVSRQVYLADVLCTRSQAG
ncbi:MAG: beta/gamma crystallin-related protein [Thermaurantiacus sp.]